MGELQFDLGQLELVGLVWSRCRGRATSATCAACCWTWSRYGRPERVKFESGRLETVVQVAVGKVAADAETVRFQFAQIGQNVLAFFRIDLFVNREPSVRLNVSGQRYLFIIYKEKKTLISFVFFFLLVKVYWIQRIKYVPACLSCSPL